MGERGISPGIRYRLQVGALRVFRALVCFLPERLSLALGDRLADLLRILLPGKVRIIRENLEHCDLLLPEGLERTTFEKRVFRHFGRLGIEFLRMKVMTDAMIRERMSISGRENLEEEIAQGKGALLLSGHIGNWELALRGVIQCVGFPLHPVIRRIKNAAVHDFVDRHRLDYGYSGSILSDFGIRPLLRTLSKNDALVIVLDQNAGSGEGEFVPFFGRSACTYSSLAKLSLLRDLPVIPVISYRTEDGLHHQVSFGPPIRPMTDLPVEEAIHRQTALYTKVLEGAIRAHPEQWIWMHRRWKTRPRGEFSPTASPE